MSARESWGFADSHSVLLGYVRVQDAEHAARRAQTLADLRGEAIEYWIDNGDEEVTSKIAKPLAWRRGEP